MSDDGYKKMDLGGGSYALIPPDKRPRFQRWFGSWRELGKNLWELFWLVVFLAVLSVFLFGRHFLPCELLGWMKTADYPARCLIAKVLK